MKQPGSQPSSHFPAFFDTPVAALPAAGIDASPSSSVFFPILPGWWNWQTR